MCNKADDNAMNTEVTIQILDLVRAEEASSPFKHFLLEYQNLKAPVLHLVRTGLGRKLNVGVCSQKCLHLHGEFRKYFVFYHLQLAHERLEIESVIFRQCLQSMY